jgi:hypothetical protein
MPAGLGRGEPMPRPYGRARRLLARMSEATRPLSPHLAVPARATVFGSIGQRPSILWNLLVLLCRLRYEQTMNVSVPIRPTPHLSLRGRVPFDWQIGRTNPSKHILAERTQTHRANRSPTRCSDIYVRLYHSLHATIFDILPKRQNEANGENLMKTMFEDERCNLRR